MKHLFWLLIPLIASCSSPEKKAKKAIKYYLSKNMNDFSSYEPVEFTSLEVVYRDFENTIENIEANEKIEKLKFRKDSINNKIDHFRAVEGYAFLDPKLDSMFLQIGKVNDSINRIAYIINQKKNIYEPDTIGYKMMHTYRGKNSYGAKVLDGGTFYFDKKIETVISYSRIND